jgi:hypothetical protein
MSEELHEVGTRFKYYPFASRQQTPRPYWEGVVVRTYDEWAGRAATEILRLDTGELRSVSSTWWRIMIAGTWANTDLIVITPP